MAARQSFLFIVLLVSTPCVFSTEVPIHPDVELLEFLGNFETGDGDWIDPLDLVELRDDELPDSDKKLSPDELTGIAEINANE